jgi:hypothetical protein
MTNYHTTEPPVPSHSPRLPAYFLTPDRRRRDPQQSKWKVEVSGNRKYSILDSLAHTWRICDMVVHCLLQDVQRILGCYKGFRERHQCKRREA